MMQTYTAVNLVLDFCVIGILILGIWLFRKPFLAKYGNMAAAAALACAAVLVIARNGIAHPGIVLFCLMAGAVPGYWVAKKITMIQIPAMVAFQHGAGGIAAFFLSLAELLRGAQHLGAMNEISGLLGLAIGSLTFSGSMIAAGKLSGKLGQTPTILPNHTRLVMANLGAMVVLIMAAFYAPAEAGLIFYLLIIGLSILFGIVFSIRIGGADMPVLISFLNATAGVAAAFCGMIIENQLLIACGATVAASGSILTHVMCKAMNRSLFHVFVPEKAPEKASKKPTTGPAGPDADHDTPAPAAEYDTAARADLPPTAAQPAGETEKTESDPFERAADLARKAETVIIVPGYGMAVAQAQFDVIDLSNRLAAMGKQVIFAIHPVAGRMPGHMNVLLAEAGVDYDMLAEMDEVNPRFSHTDLCLVIGACDVVNPAAMETDGSPISGMPILRTHEAKHVICCNLDDQPGYSGVENTLYQNSNTLMLLGNAKQTIRQLADTLSGEAAGAPDGHTDPAPRDDPAVLPGKNPLDTAVTKLASARKVIVIPGYGMAMAQAQFKVMELTDLLASRGADVTFAIHPVAGRMPGHMNVLLAEAEVDYDKLVEMDDINPEFSRTDAVIVIGACDVVNPAAMEIDGSPISGMPILKAHEAKTIIVCNFDAKPGYSGVENPLYDNPKTIMLTGDALATTGDLITGLKNTP
jgi:H+-translocating NAD(P) transhydrogenase subunit beta